MTNKKVEVKLTFETIEEAVQFLHQYNSNEENKFTILNEGGDKKLYGVVKELDAKKLYEENENDSFKIPEFKEDELVSEEELETKAEEEVPDFNSEIHLLGKKYGKDVILVDKGQYDNISSKNVNSVLEQLVKIFLKNEK